MNEKKSKQKIITNFIGVLIRNKAQNLFKEDSFKKSSQKGIDPATWGFTGLPPFQLPTLPTVQQISVLIILSPLTTVG